MPEETFPTTIIPGPYIKVLPEGLITPAAVPTGNVGIVGSAENAQGETLLLSGYPDAQTRLGPYDAYDGGKGKHNLTRALELLYRNGGGVVYARSVAADADQSAYEAAFNELLKEDIQILVAPQLSTKTAFNVLKPIVDNAENEGRELIAVIGSDETTATKIKGQVQANDRIIFTAPGIKSYDVAAKSEVDLGGTYGAVAVAGLLSTLAPQTSPTNKVLPGVGFLAQRFSYGETQTLIEGGVVVLEERQGVRIVRGITTEHAVNGPFRQITTRRIIDYAKVGIRQASNPFIGRLNNARVRKALHGAISGFLNSMLVDEALIKYEVEVTATRQDELQGKAIVNAIVEPAFSMEFILITLTVQ
jgi:hypothetical protein